MIDTYLPPWTFKLPPLDTYTGGRVGPQIYRVGLKHFILADYQGGLYYAALTDKLERECRRCTGYSHAQVSAPLAFVAGLTRRYYTHTAAVAALAKLVPAGARVKKSKRM